MATLGTFVAGQVLTAAELNDIGTWTDYTPTWSNLTVGNGTVTAKYCQLNEIVFWQIELLFGSTTAISGGVSVTYPVTAASTFLGAAGGVVSLDNGSVNTMGILWRNNTTQVNIMAATSGSTYVGMSSLSSTVPFTWNAGDRIVIEDFYRAA